MHEENFAKVIIDVASEEVDHPFDYAIPSEFRPTVNVGSTVLVNFGHALQVGYVVGTASQAAVASPSSILEVLDDEPVFDQKMVELCRWICEYYVAPFSQTLKLALPPGRERHLNQQILLNGPSDEIVGRISPSARKQREVLLFIDEQGGKTSLPLLRKRFGKSVSANLRILEKQDLVARKYSISEPRVNVKSEEYVRLAIAFDEAQILAGQLYSKAPKQHAILECLLQQSPISAHELLSSSRASRDSLKSLIKKGIVSTYSDATYREPDFYYPEALPEKMTLTEEQSEAVQRIKSTLHTGKSQVFLLQGITGSGKTEVYIRVIEEVLGAGKTAIVLVPEIALTPQTAHRFRNAFGDKVAVLHSGLGVGERFDQWRRVKNGDYKVVVGARSALFAPLDNLGLIVVDEEHEASYKQNKIPRYDARMVALKRAQIFGCPVILGSATPAVESRYRAECEDHTHLLLENRIGGRQLPAIQIVDMKEELKQGNKSIFSLALQREMNNCLEANGKFILFMNRRGYSNFLLCRDCGFVPKCKRCAVSLTYHQDAARLNCHHCDYTVLAPQVCPDCGSPRIRYFGVGTQRVEKELNQLIPGLLIVRMDADTTTARDAHRRKLIEFQKNERSVLLGTQMIAKGLDFPEVTLVGIINADTALNLPDFRAAERTFQLLMQVSGRAGRGAQPGKVVVQTYLPDNYAISALFAGSYESFYQKEVALRRELSYPPFCQLVNILVSGESNEVVEDVAHKIGEFLATSGCKEILSVLGPAPAPLARIKNRFRWHVVLKVSDAMPVSKFLRENLCKMNWRQGKEEINVIVDIDPVWML